MSFTRGLFFAVGHSKHACSSSRTTASFRRVRFRATLLKPKPCVCIAADGIWDVLSNDEVVRIVGKAFDSAGSAANPASVVVDAAIRKVCEDNGLIRWAPPPLPAPAPPAHYDPPPAAAAAAAVRAH